MEINRKSYLNSNWHSFAYKIKARDNFQCLKCGRTDVDTVLQVHHKFYVVDLQPWEYALSDCITLCKGCHAEVHKIVEPNKGWTLISVYDLGGNYGTCERIGCGHEIRHEHEIYHPDWGYKIVGSKCVEYLTEEDKWLSEEILKTFKKISKFAHESIWETGFTKKGKDFIGTTHKHHQLRIYGNDKNYSFQVIVKELGEKWFDWSKPMIFTKNKSLIEVKEMAYVVLKGTIAESEYEKNILRNIYKQMR